MTENDQTVLVDVYGKPATPISKRVFPAFPRIDLTIETQRTVKDIWPFEWEEKQKGNRAHAKAALFDLSQYKDDRDLLEWARENKVKIIFDLQETRSHQADGYCDFRKNAVIVKPGISVMCAQYAIIHELQHMFDRANGLVADNSMSMKSGIAVSRALEANANTREALHAWGCEYGIAEGFYKPARVVEAYEAGNNISEIATAARASAPYLQEGNKDQFCRDVFQAFYRQESQITFYDEGKLNFLTAYASELPKPRVEQNYKSSLDWLIDKITLGEWRFNRIAKQTFDRNMSTLMSDDSWTHEKISEKIPFLSNASFSLDDPQYCGLSHGVQDQYSRFVETIEALKAVSGYMPKCEIPVCLFLPEDQVSLTPTKSAPAQRMSNIVEVPISAPVNLPKSSNPKWKRLNMGNLPSQAPAAQQARLG